MLILKEENQISSFVYDPLRADERQGEGEEVGDLCRKQGDYVGINTGNREKISCSQAEPCQVSCLAVA